MGYNAEQSTNSCSVPVEKVKEKERLQKHIKVFDCSTVPGLGCPGHRHSVTNALRTEIVHLYHTAFIGWHMWERGREGDGGGKTLKLAAASLACSSLTKGEKASGGEERVPSFKG